MLRLLALLISLVLADETTELCTHAKQAVATKYAILSNTQIEDILRDLFQKKIYTPADIRKNRDLAEEIIKKHAGENGPNVISFIQVASTRFSKGSEEQKWNSVFKHMGIEPRKAGVFTDEQLGATMTEIEKLGYSVNRASLKKTLNQKIVEAIKQNLNEDVDPAKFVSLIDSRLGNYEDAIKKYTKNHDDHIGRLPSEAQTLKVVKALEAKKLLTEDSFKTHAEEIEKTIDAETGRVVSAAAFLKNARQQHGSWYETLLHCKVERPEQYTDRKITAGNKILTKPRIETVFLDLEAFQVPLNKAGIKKEAGLVRKVLKSHFPDHNFTEDDLIAAAHILYKTDSWRTVLEGVNIENPQTHLKLKRDKEKYLEFLTKVMARNFSIWRGAENHLNPEYQKISERHFGKVVNWSTFYSEVVRTFGNMETAIQHCSDVRNRVASYAYTSTLAKCRGRVPREALEDLAQEVAISALNSLSNFDPKLSLESWVSKIVYARVQDYFRHENREKRKHDKALTPIEDADQAIDSKTYDPEIAERKTQEAEVLRRITNVTMRFITSRESRFDKNQRNLYISYLTNKYSEKELSEIYSIPVQTVRNRVFAMRQENLKHLISEGLIPEDSNFRMIDLRAIPGIGPKLSRARRDINRTPR